MKAEAAGLVRRLAAASSTLRSVHFARNRGVWCRRAKKDKEPFPNPLVFYILGVIPPPLGFASEQNLSNIFQILNTFVTCVSTEWRYVAISSGAMMDFQNKSEFISIIATALATGIHSVPSELASRSVAVFVPGRAPSCLAKRSAARLWPSSALRGSRCPSSGSPLQLGGWYLHAHGKRPDLHLFSLHHVPCKSGKTSVCIAELYNIGFLHARCVSIRKFFFGNVR